MEEKKNQIWAFIITGMLILVSLIYYKANPYYLYTVVYIWFGFAYGLMLQYGRVLFCICVKRPVCCRGSENGSRGFDSAYVFQCNSGCSFFNQHEYVSSRPFGIHMVISGVVFGLGMVLPEAVHQALCIRWAKAI